MFTRSQWIEHINSVNDPRNNVLDTGLEPDEDEMVVLWTHDHYIEDKERDIPEVQALGDVDSFEVTTKFPAKFEVCDLCNGKGSHVNPSIDAGGISEDDEFWEDDQDDEYEWDDEASDAYNKKMSSRYARGDYDVPCNQCGGKRVVLGIDRDACTRSKELTAALAEYDEFLEDAEEFAAEQRAERRMGC